MTKPTYSNKASRVYLSPSLGPPFLHLHSWLNSPLFVTRRPETPGLMERERCSFPVCVCVKPLQSCPTFGDPMDYGPPGSSVCGTFQARTLEWVAVPSPRGSVQPTDRTCDLCLTSPALAGGFFTTSATWVPGVPLTGSAWVTCPSLNQSLRF